MSLATQLNFSSSTPAAPSGKRNGVPQNDGGSPCNQSFYVPNTTGVLAVQGTGYTSSQADSGKILPCTGTITVDLPTTGSPLLPSVDADWELYIQNNGSGTVTVSGNGCDIDGSTSSIALTANQGVLVRLTEDGSGFQSFRGIGGSGGGSSPNFADGEVVSGSGTSWTLANAPSPSESLILVQRLPDFGGVVLFHEEGSPVVGDYTLSGTSITTTNSISTGGLRAWYRY